MEKMTKKEMFNQIKSNYNLNAEEIAFIDHEIDLLSKKNQSNGKPTKSQLENEKIKAQLLELMQPGVQYSITDLQDLLGDVYSNQKVSALARQLKADKELVNEKVKGKSLYALA